MVTELAPCSVERGDVFAVDRFVVEADGERWLGGGVADQAGDVADAVLGEEQHDLWDVGFVDFDHGAELFGEKDR